MESIGTLAGGIAHDFNNILGIILGSAELALDDTPEWSPVRKNVEEIRDAALRAQEVIRRLMRFSRKSEYEPRPVRLGALVEDALNLLRATIPVTVRIDVSVPEDLPAILADSTQVHQVILNLCTNAAQAMEKEGGVLTLRVAPYALGEKRPVEFREMQPGEYLALEVGDTGPGIDPGIVNRIFDPYFTTKEVGKGSGMGLSVVHGIMRNHGGGIRVTSEPGKGARFTALFPVSKKDPEDAPTPDYDGEPSSGGEERILVVDDEENVLRVVKHMLVGFGYGVETFTDPQKALEAFRAEPERFDLVLSDLTMPGITGDRLTKEVHSIRPEKAMLETGAADFIEKPVRKADLGRRVRQALDEASRIRREED
jgi:CheY-like chemotaxis protein